MASGRLNGTCTGGSASKYSFWVDWSSSVIGGQNASYVNAYAYVQRNDGYAGSAWNNDVSASSKKITVAGTTRTSSSKGIDTRNSKKVLIASISNLRVNHDSSGYCTVSVSASFPRVASSLTGGSLSGKISLDHIEMGYPVFNSFSARGISQTEIQTDFTTDVASDRYSYTITKGTASAWESPHISYDGKTIRGLEPNTTYSLQVRAYKVGTNNYTNSPVRTTKTLPVYITKIGLQDFSADVGVQKLIPTSILPSNASIKTLSFTVSDNNICEVKNNYIIAKQPGTVTLTAKTTDGSNITETAKVTCIQRVKGITVAQSQISIPKGGSAVLTYSIQPNNATDKSVTVTVEDETIATASEIVVLGIENGVTKVRITTNDGGFFADVVVNVVGDYIWYQYDEYIDILNYWDLAHIYDNMQALSSILIKKGFSVKPLEPVQVSFETEYAEMFDILQNMEYNLDRLSDNECYSVYYGEPKTVGEYGENKADIFRWVQILNDMHDILSGDIGKWQVLECTDGIPTIDGKEILVRGELVG